MAWKQPPKQQRRQRALLLSLPLAIAALVSLICLLFLAPQGLFFLEGLQRPGFFFFLRDRDASTLDSFQRQVQKCVERNGLGLTATVKDACKIVLKYPEGTNSTWRNEQFKIYEPLEYEFDVCETLLLWEQYRNVTTILTREYLDARPDGWMDYAAKRIAQLGAANCSNRSLCEEHLELILPPKPPFWPRQFRTCAVVGNSGDLLKTEFGKEIDAHDIVIRDNEAPVTTKYAKHVGMKRSFRLMARGVVRNLLEVAKGSDDEVLIIKSVIHRDFNAKIKLLPNPVYLFQGVVFRRGAKGTGIKSLELALSMCDSVDMYGFTVDPGYTEWTRYFSAPRKGHNPLQGRAYYQLLECLGTMRLHSPMREARKQDWSVIPTRATVNAAYYAAMGLKRKPGKDHGAFKNCKVWGSSSRNGRLSGSKDMSETRKNSNYAKWEKTSVNSLRSQAQHHYRAMEGVTMYKIDGNKLEDLVCIRPQQEEQRSHGK
ncbi:sialyltransferase-like protein 5 [Selaginella moellendorffii]|nr:sialyltransferase-like protein 5 [Selaginella moellendorffii]|eukprot:XP_002962143.2 sialyltransferase-like protein 5 [Selaginella moellendorffii]